MLYGSASYDRTLGDKVKITILAAGFDVTIDESKSRGTRSRVVNFNRNKKEEEHDATQRLGDEYGKEAVLRRATRPRRVTSCLRPRRWTTSVQSRR